MTAAACRAGLGPDPVRGPAQSPAAARSERPGSGGAAGSGGDGPAQAGVAAGWVRWPRRRDSASAPARTSSVHSAPRSSVQRIVGTEMLMAATTRPPWSYTGADTQRTASFDSQLSYATPSSRTWRRWARSFATEVMLLGVIPGRAHPAG